jgi:hypothetical protein
MVRRAGSGRLVVVGDLNGADDALIEILKGTGLLDSRLHWSGGDANLVQVGICSIVGVGRGTPSRCCFACSAKRSERAAK